MTRHRTIPIAFLGILLVLVQTGTAFAKAKPAPAPALPPAGVTEEQAEQSYQTHFNEMLKETGPVQDSVGEVSPMYVPQENGDMRSITQNNTWASGKIPDESRNGLYGVIEYIVMKVVSMAYATVAEIISAVEALWGLHDPQIGVTAATYHEYVHQMRIMQYYKDGSWYNGAGVEQRNVWGSSWSSYVRTDGQPVQQWASNLAKLMTTYQGCHYNDDNWLMHTAQGTYLGEWSYTVESYNSCLPWAPF